MFHSHNIPTGDFQNPRQMLGHLLPTMDVSSLPANLDDFDVCRLIFQIMSSTSSDGFDPTSSSLSAAALSSLFLVQRDKILDFNTLEQCVDMIDKSKNIIVLTGAGCSVSCGIPDFRSRDGIYARLRVDFPDLPDPQAMFDILYFEHDPRPFFKFAREIYPGQFKPSLSHMFIKKLEDHGKLLRNYTQNIDTLEMTANIKNAILCHGSFATASCTVCKFKVDSEFIREKIFNQEIPYCHKCKEEEETRETQENGETGDEEANSASSRRVGILKPDIIFFGEGLPEIYHQSINEDKSKCDLLIVIGSSLKVKPVANIPHLLPADVPQILINRESLKHMNFDVELLGDCDGIVNELLLRLDEKRKQKEEKDELEWANICSRKETLTQIADQEAEQLLFNTNSPQSSPEPQVAETTKSNEEKQTEEENLEQEETQKLSLDPAKRYTKDYLKENTFLYLKPNTYIFHGAEISLRNTKKKLNRLRKKLNMTDDLMSSESDEILADSDRRNGKEESYLSELYKSQPIDDDDDEDDDEYDEEFSDDDSDEDSDESDEVESEDEGDDENEKQNNEDEENNDDNEDEGNKSEKDNQSND